MFTEVSLDSLGLKIHLRPQGQGEIALLMIHGIPTNALLWRHLQNLLESRYTTYAMDMLGYGESDMPINGPPYTLNNQVEVVRQVIDNLSLRGKVVLVGHDHGGGVAQIMASKYPEYVHRLILVNPVSFDYWPVLEVEGLASLAGAPDDILRTGYIQASASFPALMRTGCINRAALNDRAIKDNYLKFWGRGPGLTGFKSLIKACKDPSNDETLNIDYSRIRCPTLICWALEDAWMPKEAASRIKSSMYAPVRVDYIERSGHWSQEDRPDVLAQLFDDFLTEWMGVRL